MTATLLFLGLTYLLAAVPFGLVITTIYGGDLDLRAAGSGNIGTTNVARLYGWRIAAPVLGLDVAKGLVPVLLARGMFTDHLAFLGLVAAVAFVGHCWPVYLEFRGGKGVATGAGGLLGIAPLPVLGAAAVWAVALRVTGRSSVAALVASAALVGLVMRWWPEVLPLAALLAAGVAVRHLSNLGRLFRGEEAPVVTPVRWQKAHGPTRAADVLAQDPAGRHRAEPLWKERAHDPLDGPTSPGTSPRDG